MLSQYLKIENTDEDLVIYIEPRINCFQFVFCSDPLSQSDLFKMGLRVTGHTGEAKLKVS